MRIAAVFQPKLPNGAYRAVIPMAALQRRGHEVKMFPQEWGEPPISIQELATYDVVHVHRMIVNEDDSWVEELHALGGLVSFDNDDDAGGVPPELWTALEEQVHIDHIARIRREYERSLALVPQVDLVTTPSEVLADRFEAAGAREVRAIDNFVPPEFLRIKAHGREGFIVGWHAGREHFWDRDMLGISEVLGRVLEAHPHVHVVSIGVGLELESNRYTHVAEGVPLAELTNHLADFDIGIAPLAQNEFNRARSRVKLREYGAAGVPWLASPVGPYEGLGKAEGGRLVPDGEWFEALDRLIRSPFERAKLRRRAKSWAHSEVIDRTVGLWEDAFSDLLVSQRSAA